MLQLHLLYKYRFFVLSSILHEYQSRFARSRLGFAWMIFHPLTQVAIYSLVLSSVFSQRLPAIDNRFSYAIYLMAGTLFWSLFSEIVTRCLTIFIDNGNVIKKMVFPKICLPIIATGIALINNSLLLLVILCFFVLVGHFPSVSILWLPLLLLETVIFSLTVGLLLGVLNVFIRDVGHFVPILLQLLFWTTPIVYTKTIIPASYRFIVNYNPLTVLVTEFQNILVQNVHPSLITILWFSFFLILLYSFVYLFFKKASKEMIDVL